MRRFLLALGFLAALAGPAAAVQPGEMLADPALEARARHLSKELRCLVCRNENIDDSSAGLARDLRLLVRERIAAGDSDQEAMDYIVERFGEFVLLRPRLSGANLAIWLTGPALLLAGGIGAWLFIRRRRDAPPEVAALTPEEAARLRELSGE